MKISEIKDGDKFLTPKESDGKGRIGIAYAVTQRKLEQGFIDLNFDGPGCVFAGKSYLPPSGIYKLSCLEKINQ